MYDIWYTGWLNQPIWKICSSKWKSSPNRDENEKSLKPPRLYMHDIWYMIYVYVFVSSSQAHINLLGTNMFSLTIWHKPQLIIFLFPRWDMDTPITVIKVSRPCAMKRGGPGLAEASRPCARMDGWQVEMMRDIYPLIFQFPKEIWNLTRLPGKPIYQVTTVDPWSQIYRELKALRCADRKLGVAPLLSTVPGFFSGCS